MASGVRLADGSFSFDSGVDSGRTTTVQTQANPHGLMRTQLAWLQNATVRGGGITQRYGFQFLLSLLLSKLYQGGFMYEPLNANPYLMLSVAGHIYKALLEAPFTVTDLSAEFGVFNPPTPTQTWWVQGEQFVVIQAGDIYTNPTPTLPLFWDGTTLRRSVGLGTPGAAVGTYTLTTTVGWVVPAVGNSVVVTLTGPYPGNVGDQLQWPGYGTFTVNQISGNTITLVTVASTLAGATVPPGTYVVPVNHLPASNAYSVTTTTSPTQPFFAGNTFNVTLNVAYPGAVGDTIQWVGVGSYTVLGLTNANKTVALQLVTLQQNPGTVIVAGAYTWVAASPSAPSTNNAQALTTSNAPVQPFFAGNTINAVVTTPYTGTVGDTVYWIGVGNYKLVGLTGGGTILSLSLIQQQASSGLPIAAGAYVFVDSPPTSGGTTPGTTFVPELPAAGPMVYYAARIWYAQGRIYTAGDIVRGPSGTAAYDLTDSILKVTENPLAIGGDGFAVPANSGNITALAYSANQDSALGQGPLYIFTRKQVFKLDVPVSRADWIAANGSNQPLQTIVQIKYGSVGDRCVVHVNGDLFYQSLEPAIRSLFVSVRYFSQWANVPISRNENRVLASNNRALMPTATGINFDNRLLQAVLPYQTPVGVAFQGIVPLDFDIISTFGAETDKVPPAWEGMLEGIDVLQLFEGDFGGLARAFAVIHSRVDGTVQIWEISGAKTRDNVDSRVAWYLETPAYNFDKDAELKQLDGGEIWIDRVYGLVEYTVQWRVDADPCWQDWARGEFCSARDSCEDASDPVCSQYPLPTFCEGYKFPIVLPTPPVTGCATMNKRPMNRGYQFQVRINLKGFCRIRGLLIFGIPVERAPFDGLNC